MLGSLWDLFYISVLDFVIFGCVNDKVQIYQRIQRVFSILTTLKPNVIWQHKVGIWLENIMVQIPDWAAG